MVGLLGGRALVMGLRCLGVPLGEEICSSFQICGSQCSGESADGVAFFSGREFMFLVMVSMSFVACVTLLLLPLAMKDVSSRFLILLISAPVVSLMLMIVAPFFPMILAAVDLFVVMISVVASLVFLSLLSCGLVRESVLFLESCTVILIDSSSYLTSLSFTVVVWHSFVMVLLIIMHAPSVRWMPSWVIRFLSVSMFRGSDRDVQHRSSTRNATSVKKKGVETIHFAQFWWKIGIENFHFS